MKHALILSGGWPGHHPQETSEFVAQLLAPEGFHVEISPTLDLLAEPVRLQFFDLIIPNWTMGTLTKEQSVGLNQAITSGVGLAGFHGGAGDAFRENTEYQFMIGGQFVAHPDNLKEYSVQILPTPDSLLLGIDDFTVQTEQYYLHVDPANRVLATTTFQTISAPHINGTVMPVVWTRQHGQGKVFYLAIGHSPADLAVPEVREILRRGLVWAAKKSTDDTRLKISYLQGNP